MGLGGEWEADMVTKLNMLPIFPLKHKIDCCSTYTIPSSKGCHLAMTPTVAAADVLYSGLSEDVISVLLAGELWRFPAFVAPVFFCTIKSIVFISAKINMTRPYTGWVVALMAGQKPFRYRSLCKLPRCTRSILRNPLKMAFPVSLMGFKRRPNPTTRFQNERPVLINLIPKSFHFPFLTRMNRGENG